MKYIHIVSKATAYGFNSIVTNEKKKQGRKTLASGQSLHSSPSDLEPFWLFNLFMTEDRK